MSERRPIIAPRLLSADAAADYCGISAPTFKAECPVIPIKIRTRVLYDRHEIDRWIDSRLPSQPKLSRDKWLKRLEDVDADQGR